MLSVRPPLNQRNIENSDTESESESDINSRAAEPADNAETGSVVSHRSTIDIDALLAGKHDPPRNLCRDTSDTEEDVRIRRRSLRPPRRVLSHSGDWDYAVRELPPNRTPRYLEASSNHTVVNLKTRNDQDLLFNSSEPLERDKGTDDGVTRDSKVEDNNNPACSPSTAAAQMQSALIQVPPFFSWSMQGKEHPQNMETSADILNDVDSFLRQRFTYMLGQKIQTAHLASLYKSLKRPDNYVQLTEMIDADFNTHPRIEPLQGTVSISSWQTLLFELLHRCDTIMKAFCSVGNDCTVTQKFAWARAALFKVRQLLYTFQPDSMSLFLEDTGHLSPEPGPSPYRC